MTDTQTLLVQYARDRSESAFRELVSRYVNLVYSSALRVVDGDRHIAEDVAQQVFADLSSKAGSLGSEVMLGGWLHRRTCFVARSRMRGERRRLLRERRFVEATSMTDHSEANLDGMKAVLDEAINELRAEERVPIILRFFEHRDYRGIADALGTTEEAAQKRVSRALEKLSALLTRRGFAASAAVLATVLTGEAVAAAPAGFAAIIAASPKVTAQGLSLLKVMSLSKLKIGFGIAAVVGMAAVPFALQRQNVERLARENKDLREQVEQLDAQMQPASSLLTDMKQTEPADSQQRSELLRLRGEVAWLRREQQDWEHEKHLVAAMRNTNYVLRSNENTNPPLMLFKRTLKVDPQTLYDRIRQTYPEQTLRSTNALMLAFRWMLQTNNIEIQPPENVFLNDRTGELIVAARMTNADAIELFVQKTTAGP